MVCVVSWVERDKNGKNKFKMKKNKKNFITSKNVWEGI